MSNYKNILVYAIVNIGDVLLSTSAVALLRQRYPNARITMMVRAASAPVVRNNPLIDDVIIYEYQSKKFSFKELLSMVKLLRSRNFDLSVAFDPKFRSAILTWLAGIPVRVGGEKVFGDKTGKAVHLYTHVIPIHHELANTLQAETYQAIVRGFTGQKGQGLPVMARIMPKNEQKVATLLASLVKKDEKAYRIALCVKGTFALKNWPQEHFATLIDELNGKYEAHCFIIGAPGDKPYADEVISLTHTPVANFCGQTNLVDLAALLKQSDLFITVDTGATHVAAAMDVPMIVIYGCTSPKRWHPMSEKAVVLTTDEPCCPCSLPEGGCPGHMCVNKISVDMVKEKAEQLLGGDHGTKKDLC